MTQLAQPKTQLAQPKTQLAQPKNQLAPAARHLDRSRQPRRIWAGRGWKAMGRFRQSYVWRTRYHREKWFFQANKHGATRKTGAGR